MLNWYTITFNLEYISCGVEKGLFKIIESCEKLARLDLTSVRGVGVRERRRFFEARIFLLSIFLSLWKLILVLVLVLV
jgi:hypothetical protein